MKVEPFDIRRHSKMGLEGLVGPLSEYIDETGNKILATLRTDAPCFSRPSDLITFSDGHQINSGVYSWREISKEETLKRRELVWSESCAYSCRLPSLCEECPSPGRLNWYLEDIERYTLMRAHEVGLKSFNLRFDWGLVAYESGEGR